MKKSIILFLIFCYSYCNAQEQTTNNTIIPAPNYYKASGDSLVIKGKVKIKFEKQKFNSKELKTAQLFENILNDKLPNKSAGISIQFNTTDNTLANKESYKISITQKGILVTGRDEGLFYATQSLLQLLPNY